MQILHSFILKFHSLFNDLCESLVAAPAYAGPFGGLQEILVIIRRLQVLCKYAVSMVPPDVKMKADSCDCSLKMYLKVLDSASKFELAGTPEACPSILLLSV